MTGVDRSTPPVTIRIGGEKLTRGSGGVHGHVNPCNGQVDAEIPLAGAQEVDAAVQTAHQAFQSWRKVKPAERQRLLMKLADLIEANAEEFRRRGVLDNGTAITTTALAPTIARDWTRYYAGWADKIEGQTTSTLAADGELSYTLAQPYGVIGIIITWNGPLISLAMKIPVVLAAGNTVVVKPSELTPFSGELFADLVAQAGIPDGVVNILPGDPSAGAALVAHPLVKKVTFTGGPATARKILTACAETMKPAVLELGGKSANIVFDDADLDTACFLGTYMSVGFMAGQGCAFPTRMLVQDTIYDEICQRVVAIAKNIVIGDPFDPNTGSGPLITEAALTRVLGMIERAKADGARLIAGGSRLEGELANGYFVEPTVFADVDPDSELAQTEVFGPVLSIIPFHDDDDAIRIANNSKYGLSGYVHTTSLRRALYFAEELETGEVLVNGVLNLGVWRPFGGFGISGLGKEGGRAGFEEMLRVKGVGIRVAGGIPGLG